MHALWFRTTAAAVVAASVLAAASASAQAFTRPTANGQFDYQIGGAYAAASGVAIVDRDRLAAPAPGKYSICYATPSRPSPTMRCGGRPTTPTCWSRRTGNT